MVGGNALRDAANKIVEKAKPMAEKLREGSARAAKSLQQSAEGFREGLHGEEKKRPKPGP